MLPQGALAQIPAALELQLWCQYTLLVISACVCVCVWRPHHHYFVSILSAVIIECSTLESTGAELKQSNNEIYLIYQELCTRIDVMIW